MQGTLAQTTNCTGTDDPSLITRLPDWGLDDLNLYANGVLAASQRPLRRLFPKNQRAVSADKSQRRVAPEKTSIRHRCTSFGSAISGGQTATGGNCTLPVALHPVTTNSIKKPIRAAETHPFKSHTYSSTFVVCVLRGPAEARPLSAARRSRARALNRIYSTCYSVPEISCTSLEKLRLPWWSETKTRRFPRVSEHRDWYLRLQACWQRLGAQRFASFLKIQGLQRPTTTSVPYCSFLKISTRLDWGKSYATYTRGQQLRAHGILNALATPAVLPSTSWTALQNYRWNQKVTSI